MEQDPEPWDTLPSSRPSTAAEGSTDEFPAFPGRLKQKDAVEILDAMASEGAVEWEGTTKSTAIIYWRKPEEWANAIYEWIDNTGQKGSVLTLYEISEGDLTVSQGLFSS